MAAPATVAGAVVLVQFPFSDLSRSKLRPAVVLANVGRNDLLLCQITSNPYADAQAIRIRPENFDQGGLERVSYARPGKLFTAHESIVSREVGRLAYDTRLNLALAIKSMLEEQLEQR